MRYLLLAVLLGCGPSAKSKPDAAPDPFGEPCTPDGYAPLSTCIAADHEIGWCVDDVCRRACVAGACRFGGQPTPVYADCYCK